MEQPYRSDIARREYYLARGPFGGSVDDGIPDNYRNQANYPEEYASREQHEKCMTTRKAMRHMYGDTV